MKPADDSARHGPRPGMTLALLLAAALLVLAGGAGLSRREMAQRIPADRALLRECAATLQAELSRLDAVYLAHLQDLGTRLAESGKPDEVKSAARQVEGVAAFSVLLRSGKATVQERFGGPGVLPPEPVLTVGGKRPDSPFAMGIPAEPIFGADDTAPLPAVSTGWAGRPGDPWMAWWQRFDSQSAAVFLIRREEVSRAIERHLTVMLPGVWAPVRAAGGLDRMEGPGARTLAGNDRRAALPDFVIPLASRHGDWQILSWDRWETAVTWHTPTLILSGTLAVGLALLGWLVATAQRRALREVTARVSFVNRVSHELGAPVTNLRLYLELARDALPAGAAESHRRIAVAEEETARLSRLVENILTFARTERDRLTLHPAPCCPAAILRQVLAQFAPALTRRGITVETSFPDNSRAVLDSAALTQITANLLSNVEKYAASGGWMRLHLECSATRITLRVEDRGPGIPVRESERIFLPFERLDSRLTEGVSGTGLGLAICRDLAARMGGSISLTPGPDGTGACFTVILPHAAAHPDTAAADAALPLPAPLT